MARIFGRTMLGMCLLLEGRTEEAEVALDRALMLHPDHHMALKWKALVLARNGQEETALAIVRRLRQVEPGMTIEHHVRQMLFSPHLASRSVDEISTLRRLWAAQPHV